MAQMFWKVKPNFNGNKRNFIPMGIAYAVLTGDVQSAVDVLRLVDCDILYGEMQMSDRYSIARFYGVTEEYVYNIMSRYGITSTASPTHVKRMSGGEFCMRNGFQFSNGAWHMPDGREFPMKNPLNITWYDPRTILAFACLAFISRKVIPDSNADRILRALNKTRYYDAARKAVEDFEKGYHIRTVPDGEKFCRDEVISDPEPEESRSMDAAIAALPAMQEHQNPTFREVHLNPGEGYIPVSILPEIIKAIVPYLAK